MRLVTAIVAATLTACNGANDAAHAPLPLDAPAPVTAQGSPPPAPSPCATESGSVQVVATGFAADTVGELRYKLYPCDHLAFIYLPALAGASAATTFSVDGLPSFLVPATMDAQEVRLAGYDDGVERQDITAVVEAGSTTVRFLRNGSETGWSATGSRGVGKQVFTVFLD